MAPNSRSPITVERAAYAAIALVAAGLRWYHIGLQPLGEAEAEQALAAYRFVQGAATATPTGTVPALFTGNVLGFALLGAGEGIARWLPLVAGMVLVLLPYGLRHRLGRGGALAASLLLAVSPSAVYLSRTLDGAALVAACGLALTVGAVQYVDSRRSAPALLAAGALGLGLCAGPTFYTWLVAAAAFLPVLWLARRLEADAGRWEVLEEAWRAFRAEPHLALRFAAAAGGVFGLVATALVLHPAGIGHAADRLGAWIQGFGPQAGGEPVAYPLWLLVRYEPFILVFGLVEAGRQALRRHDGPGSLSGTSDHTGFLACWALVAFLLALAPGHRAAGSTLLVMVPLALLAGQALERAWHRLSGSLLWTEAGVVGAVALGLAVFLYLQVTGFALSAENSLVTFAGLSVPIGTGYLLLALLGVALLAGLGAAAWFWRGRAAALAGGGLALFAVLSLWSVKSAWGVSHDHAADPRELMIGRCTAPDLRVLVRHLERLSLDRTGDSHTLPVSVEAGTGPAVAWALREFSEQQVVERISTLPGTAVAVTLAGEQLPTGENLRGQGFPLRVSWQPQGLGARQMVRWLLFGEGTQPAVEQEVVLWVAESTDWSSLGE